MQERWSTMASRILQDLKTAPLRAPWRNINFKMFVHGNGTACCWDRWIITYFLASTICSFGSGEKYVCNVFLHFNTDIAC